MNFTYKKDKPATGLRAVGYSTPSTAIKLRGKEVGTIVAPSWQTKDHKWGVRIAVEKEPTKEEPASFRWIQFKIRFDSEPEARGWLQANAHHIQRMFVLHQFEP
jgi:hypothetical protein